ncbi:MAG: cytosine methyltransferase [Metamycoplasmataceae bacterium]
MADCNGKMVRTISKDGTWQVKNSQYYKDYNTTAHPVKRRYFVQKERSRIIGESTIGGTIEIIKKFKPKIWIIENPKTSTTWQFQKNHWNFEGIENQTNYSCYDENFSLKPTIFKSNIKLNLKNERIKGDKKHMSNGSYSKRSSIPNDLIISIIKTCLKELNK